MSEIVRRIDHNIIFKIRQTLLNFPRRNRYAAGNIDLSKLLQDHLPAHIASIFTIVNAVLSENLWQFLERKPGLICNSGNCGIQHLIGNLNADPVSALHLNFFDDQALQYLLHQDVCRRQFNALLGGALNDQVGLPIQFTFQDNTVVDDRGEAVASDDLADLFE